MNSKRIFKIVIECLWLAMAVFCLAVGIYYQNKLDGESNKMIWIIYAMAIISAGMFLMRFMQRRNEERREKRRNGEI